MKLSPHIALRMGLFTALVAIQSSAQVVVVPTTPQVGSSNPASPEPPLPRPSTSPCVVPLFSNRAFENFTPYQFSYKPAAAAGCAGPWTKVILTADFTVSAGRQFDRTAKFFLGGVNIYFGTTAEPRATLSPSWHVERDLTDLSALFKSSNTGYANIGNLVDSTYTGIIYASSALLFYPADAANPAPAVPSQVLSLNSASDATFLNTTTDRQSGTFTLPRNVERAYLDVIAQSQSGDEFWYTCVPSDVAGELQDCGNSGFRETEVNIDGMPAGVAPVYPWIYTGGIDPYLWEPIPGVETLNLKPYRVDLTPFAGLLSNGEPHTVSVSVFNADAGFSVASTLLLFQDTGAATVTGGITSDTLMAEPQPKYEHSLTTAANGTISGPVKVFSDRCWFISGYVNTSHGRVDTSIVGNNRFENLQNFIVSSTVYKQAIRQETRQEETTTVISSRGTVESQREIHWPLVLTYNSVTNTDGSSTATTSVKQQKSDTLRRPWGEDSFHPVISFEKVESSDTLSFNAAGALTGHSGAAQGSFSLKYGRRHDCVYRRVASKDVTLISVQDRKLCSADRQQE